jgi:hypothetical protein
MIRSIKHKIRFILIVSCIPLYLYFVVLFKKKAKQKNLLTIDENLFFLPAATSMIYEMGLESQLVGVTFECH